MAKRSKENIDPDLDDFKVKKKKNLAPNNRFKVSSRQEEIDMITKGYVPMNTQRRSTDDDGECPSDLFEVGDPDNLNFWVLRFINEVRRADGDPYPPRTIHQLLAGLQRSMLDHNNPRNFVRSYNPDCLTYIEHGSKNYSARAKDLHYENKEVPCPAIPEERPKCLVFLMGFLPI